MSEPTFSVEDLVMEHIELTSVPEMETVELESTELREMANLSSQEMHSLEVDIYQFDAGGEVQ